MKKLIVAAGLIAACAAAAPASAQGVRVGPGGVTVYAPIGSVPTWRRDMYPYESRHHDRCQRKAHRLHWFERRAAADGRLSWWERREISSLRRDLDATCRGWRWRG